MNYIDQKPLHIVAIQGSVRPHNYTARALSVVQKAATNIPGLDFEILRPAEQGLPLPGQEDSGDTASELRSKIEAADGVILATPEYHGSYSSVMKLIIDNLGFPSVLQDKPVSLLGVAAGRIGAIKALEHLRSVASHIGAHVLPEVVSIPRVRERFDENNRLDDPELEKLVEGVLYRLIAYLSRTHQSAARICDYQAN